MIEVTAKASEQVLSKPALAFVEELHRNFETRRQELLAKRTERYKKLAAGGEFEFDPAHEDKFRNLASSMKFVGIWFIIAGALGSLGGLLNMTKNVTLGATSLLSAGALLAQGIWALNSGEKFERIVKSSGNDIANLMDALVQLRKYYVVVIVVGGLGLISNAMSLLAGRM